MHVHKYSTLDYTKNDVMYEFQEMSSFPNIEDKFMCTDNTIFQCT